MGGRRKELQLNPEQGRGQSADPPCGPKSMYNLALQIHGSSVSTVLLLRIQPAVGGSSVVFAVFK